MEDKQKKYLDKVIEFLVKDTKIDYDKGRVHLSFFPYPFFLPPSISSSIFPLFSKYCKNVYGLTEDEIKYIWGEFITIIKDKIENGK